MFPRHEDGPSTPFPRGKTLEQGFGQANIVMNVRFNCESIFVSEGGQSLDFSKVKIGRSRGCQSVQGRRNRPPGMRDVVVPATTVRGRRNGGTKQRGDEIGAFISHITTMFIAVLVKGFIAVLFTVTKQEDRRFASCLNGRPIGSTIESVKGLGRIDKAFSIHRLLLMLMDYLCHGDEQEKEEDTETPKEDPPKGLLPMQIRSRDSDFFNRPRTAVLIRRRRRHSCLICRNDDGTTTSLFVFGALSLYMHTDLGSSFRGTADSLPRSKKIPVGLQFRGAIKVTTLWG